MSCEYAISVQGLGKCYHIYNSPQDRLLQMFLRSRKQYFREFWALRDVSFEVGKGETVGIIGRNGSGKSTLLQMICGTLHPTAGDLTTNGRIAALLELGSGFNPEFTGRENVFMNASLFGLTKEETEARFEAIEAFAEIGEFIEQPIKTYSSGMMVRLAFAVIANVDADILVIDEALAVGDAFFTQKCMRFLRKFRESRTLLFVSHDTASVVNLCDRALWLDHGQLRELGPAKAVSEAYLNSLFESMGNEDGGNRAANGGPRTIRRVGQSDLVWKDQRADFINASNLRNDLEVFAFSPEPSADFGGEQACITDVCLCDSAGARLSWVVGGEKVSLRIEVQANIDLQRPILGFFIKDRLGQTIFGDNTYLSYKDCPRPVTAGNTIAAEFEFFMPWLGQGDYIIQAAVAEGTQDDHRQLHWLHNALAFRSHHTPVATGIIGIPMVDIRLNAE